MLNDSKTVSQTPHQGSGNTFIGYGRSKPTELIDYILVSDDFKVLSHKTDNTRINGLYASDHDPVVVKLILTE